jgi:hypothetical protein
MQSIAELEARALRRADEADELARRLAAAEWRLRTRDAGSVERGGFWSRLTGGLKPDAVVTEIARLQTQKAHADAALKIAVDELHQAHCIALRDSPWNRTLLEPAEAEVAHASDDYHPWDRVLIAGDATLQALTAAARQPGLGAYDAARVLLALGGIRTPRLSATSRAESVQIIRAAGQAVDRFIKSVQLLQRDRPGNLTVGVGPALQDNAARMLGLRTAFGINGVHGAIQAALRDVGAIMTQVRARSRGERGELGDARRRYEQASRQVALMAWSKIPARLRPNR